MEVRLDAYIIETLMPDLVLHDRQPSAFLVYLFLTHAARGRKSVRASHHEIAIATGLSKSAVQAAIRTLVRRRLLRSVRESRTAIPEYTVMRSWRR